MERLTSIVAVTAACVILFVWLLSLAGIIERIQDPTLNIVVVAIATFLFGSQVIKKKNGGP